LVVDNNCTDHTSRVLEDYAERLPLVRAFEPKPGHSNARNRAVATASGDFIVWTDDDVLVDPGWLSGYLGAIEAHPSAVFFGGPVEPWFEDGIPAWLQRTFDQVSNAFAVRDLSAEAFRITGEGGRLPFGANYAIRRDAQERHAYDPDLGRGPDSMKGDEETTVLRALLAEGAEGWWVPEARVRHFIPAERQTVRYLRGYYEGQGEVAAASGPIPVGRLTWRGRPAWLWKEAAVSELRNRALRLTRPPERWIPALKHAAFVRGRLRASSAAGLENE
jgi:glycosyltransferase involved in cell wall biosynthesis